VAAFDAQFNHGTLPLVDGSSLKTFLAKLLNCDNSRLKTWWRRTTGSTHFPKKRFKPREGFDLDDVARRLEPLVEPFIQSLQGPSRSASRSGIAAAAPAPAPAPAIVLAAMPPPLPPPGGAVAPAPAAAAQPVAAPAPAAAAETAPGGAAMDIS
jgi:hypothetical protein